MLVWWSLLELLLKVSILKYFGRPVLSTLFDRILNLCRLQFVHKDRPWPKVDNDRNHWQKTEFPKTKNKVYNWRGPPWMMMRSSVELVYWLQWSHPWTIMRNGRFNRPYNGRTNRQHLGKPNGPNMIERLINPWMSPKVLGAVDLHQQFPAVEEVISELIGFWEPWGSY